MLRTWQFLYHYSIFYFQFSDIDGKKKWKHTTVLACLLFVLTSCGSSTASTSTNVATFSSTRPEMGNVIFQAATTYTYALQTLARFGLMPSHLCGSGSSAVDGQPYAIPWRPMANKDAFANNSNNIWAVATPLTPANWVDRLKATQNVSDVQLHVVSSCPANQPNLNAPHDFITYIDTKQVGTYIRIQFSPNTDQYGTALYEMSYLGMRLADPCFERTQGTLANWHPMGQEAFFAKRHMLVVATTQFASSNWLIQLHAAAGVVAVEVPFKEPCGY